MHKTLLAALIKAGIIDADATQGEAAAVVKAFAHARGMTLPEKLDDEQSVKPLVAALGTQTPAASDPPSDPPVVLPVNPAADGVSAADITAMINITALSADGKNELITALIPQAATLTTAQVLDAINQKCQDRAKPLGVGNPAQPAGTNASEADKFQTAARDAMVLSNLGGDQPEQIYDYRTDNYVAWSPERRNYGLSSPLNIARQCLMVSGMPAHRVFGLAPMQVAKLVMGADPIQIGLGGLFASDGAYNVSGMFSNILLDARNVTLRKSYDDTHVTFDLWMGRGADIPDFKSVHRVISGEINDPAAVPEDGTFEESTLSDGKESYKLTVWGRMLSRSWQLITNDQLGAFTETEMKMGASMRRKVNRLAYQALKDNAALADTGALFNATAITAAGGHNNLTTGGLTTVADYIAALNTMHAKMAQQKGLDADSGTLNLMAKYLVYPPAIRGIILQTLGSASGDASNPALINIWQQGLTPIEDSELGASTTNGSDTAFHTAVDRTQADTVEYAYLQGMPAPVVEQEPAFDRLAIRSRIYFAFGVKPLDFRGMQKHTGA